MKMNEIQVVVMSEGPTANRLLAEWLEKIGLRFRYGSPENSAGVDTARNQTIMRFLKEDVPKGKRYLLSFDRDMIPVETTRRILTAPGELIYCGYIGRQGSKGHIGDNEFGTSCFRVTADVLLKMKYPWCRTTMVNGARVGCECGSFYRKAFNLGITPKMVGIIGHEQTCIIIPSNTKLGWSLLWSKDINYESVTPVQDY